MDLNHASSTGPSPVAGMTRRQMLRSSGFALGGALLAGTLLACSDESSSSPVSGKTRLAFQLGWLGSAQVIGEAVALKKGYYADHGIDMTFREGGPNADPPTLVGTGSSPAGIANSSPSLMEAAATGLPIQGFAAGFQEHPWALISLKKNPIRSPDDLIGKRIGTQPTSQVLLDAIFAKYGISRDQVEIVGAGNDTTVLTAGQVDVWTGWVVNYGQLQPLGSDYESLRLWDLGIQLYAQVYIANQTFLKEQPEVVDGVLEASAAGWAYARQHLEESVKILGEVFPNIDPEIETETAKLVFDVVFTSATEAAGWGAMQKSVWEDQIKVYDDLGQFKSGPPDVNDVMTLDALRRTESARRKVG